jgi:hypothetical protein
MMFGLFVVWSFPYGSIRKEGFEDFARLDKWNDSKQHPETTVGTGPSLSSYFFRLCPKLGPSLFGRSTDPRSRSSRHHALLSRP